MKKLYRSRDDQVFGGVCKGVSRYFDVDVTLIRLVWALAVFLGGTGVAAYIIAWIIIPEEPGISEQVIDVGEGQGQSSGADSRTIGLIIMVIGLFFLFRNIIPSYVFRQAWPLIIVFIGLFMIFGGMRGGKR